MKSCLPQLIQTIEINALLDLGKLEGDNYSSYYVKGLKFYALMDDTHHVLFKRLCIAYAWRAADGLVQLAFHDEDQAITSDVLLLKSGQNVWLPVRRFESWDLPPRSPSSDYRNILALA